MVSQLVWNSSLEPLKSQENWRCFTFLRLRFEAAGCIVSLLHPTPQTFLENLIGRYTGSDKLLSFEWFGSNDMLRTQTDVCGPDSTRVLVPHAHTHTL